MNKVKVGDQVIPYGHPGNIRGDVIEIVDGPGETKFASIDLHNGTILLEYVGYVTVTKTIIHCRHTPCNAFTQSRPGADYWCPDHLGEIFDHHELQTPC
jgi:hypothetical protein